MGKNRFSGVTGWMALMSIGGILIGLAGYLSMSWVTVVLADADPIAQQAVDGYGATILSAVALLVAPALATLFSLYRTRTGEDSSVVTETAIGSLVGTVIYVIIALPLIGRFMPEGGPTLFDIVSIAGLVALTAVLSATATAAIFANLYGGEREDVTDDEDETPTMELPAVSDSAN